MNRKTDLNSNSLIFKNIPRPVIKFRPVPICPTPEAKTMTPEQVKVMEVLVIWLEGSLTCDKHRWDGDQYAAAKSTVEDAKRIISVVKGIS